MITLDQLDYDNSKFIKTLQPLLLPCTACQSENLQVFETSPDPGINMLPRSNTEAFKTYSIFT